MLSQADLTAIAVAVQEAEARTSGEIYCVVAPESADYREVPLAWAAGAAILAPAILTLGGVRISVSDMIGGWSAAQVGAAAERAVHEALIGVLVLQALLFIVVLIVASLAPVRRLLTPRGLKRERVRTRAREQFLAKNLHQTRDRTGVLIFVSLGERMAELIADDGIASKLEPRAWDPAMAALTGGLRHGRPAEGFISAIGLCAAVLERFPAPAGDNPNELPDAVVVLE
jgi:putative membrane protein